MRVPIKWTVAAIALAIFLAVLSAGIGARKYYEGQLERSHRIRDLRIVCYLYSGDHDGLWPPLTPSAPRFMYDPAQVRTAYSIDKPVQGKMDNADPALVMGFLNGQKAYSLRPISDPAQYAYLGYAVTNESEGLALIDAVNNAESSAFASDLPAPSGKGTLGGDRFVRLNAAFDGGKTEEETAALRAKVPAIIERPINDGRKTGGWVVYLDLHSEFVPYPGPFPMTESFIKQLESTR